MKNKIIYLVVFAFAFSLTSCSKVKKKQALVYMPDMYYPVAYDPYEKANFEYWPVRQDKDSQVPIFAAHDEMTALWPAEMTVPQTEDMSLLPWELKGTLGDYMKSKSLHDSPLNPANREEDLRLGEKYYHQTCAVCHGDKGDGQGPIVKSGAYSGVPTFEEREISIGSVYHVIMYGLNAMGPYAAQLQPVDRWRVAEYVMSLKGGSAAPAPAADDNDSENTNQ